MAAVEELYQLAGVVHTGNCGCQVCNAIKQEIATC